MNITKNVVKTGISTFKTEHLVEYYIEVFNIEDIINAIRFAKNLNRNYLILANGSNIFFSKRKIKTVIIVNKIEKTIEELANGYLIASSSVNIITLLNYCYSQRLESFYYLASVPGTVGGALAMNAGRGKVFNKTIYDHVISVTYIDNEGNLIISEPDKLNLEYRKTIFTGINNMFIVNALFQFDKPLKSNSDPITERKIWAKKKQDYSKPNCGSVFKTVDWKILYRLRGFQIKSSGYSRKTLNWIINENKNPLWIHLVIKLTIFIHKLRRKQIELELIKV